MRFFVGTSSYSERKWIGKFYPAKLPQKQMLEYYAEHFPTVELNGTFYKMPTASGLQALAEQVPAGFQFAVKAPQSITHIKRLKDAEEQVELLLDATAALKKQLGPLLFQLPPNFKKDLPRLEAFLRLLPKKPKTAFEFRHASWLDEEVIELLRKNSVALCLADMDDAPAPAVVSTAGWGYVRLRREKYTPKRLSQWIKQFQSKEWAETYVFFKHEETGIGPKLAARFLQLVGE